jgi:hypothetical protein
LILEISKDFNNNDTTERNTFTDSDLVEADDFETKDHFIRVKFNGAGTWTGLTLANTVSEDVNNNSMVVVDSSGNKAKKRPTEDMEFLKAIMMFANDVKTVGTKDSHVQRKNAQIVYESCGFLLPENYKVAAVFYCLVSKVKNYHRIYDYLSDDENYKTLVKYFTKEPVDKLIKTMNDEYFVQWVEEEKAAQTFALIHADAAEPYEFIRYSIFWLMADGYRTGDPNFTDEMKFTMIIKHNTTMAQMCMGLTEYEALKAVNKAHWENMGKTTSKDKAKIERFKEKIRDGTRFDESIFNQSFYTDSYHLKNLDGSFLRPTKVHTAAQNIPKVPLYYSKEDVVAYFDQMYNILTA